MYLIVTKRTISFDGDERSRTNPGHGYGAYTKEVDVNIYFQLTEKDKLIEEIKRLSSSNTKYKLFSIKPIEAKVSTTVEVSLT